MAKRAKKDFDKDKMYLKIMPSAAQPAQSADTAETVEEPQLHNFMEDMVLEKLEHTLTVLGGCPCERCRKDVVALALNELPTAYAVAQGDRARHMKKLRGAFEIKVTAALIKAVQLVKQHPRH